MSSITLRERFGVLLGLSFDCFLVLRLLDKLSDMLDAEKGLCGFSFSIIKLEFSYSNRITT